MNESTFVQLRVTSSSTTELSEFDPLSNDEAFVNPASAVDNSSSPLFVEIRRHEGSKSVLVLKLKFSEAIPKGQIFFPLRSWISDTCLVRLKTIEMSDSCHLNTISIRCDDQAIVQLQSFLTHSWPCFVREGNLLSLAFTNEGKDAKFLIDSTQPSKSGLISQSTVVEIMKLPCPTNLWPIVRYSVGLISPNHTIPYALSHQIKCLAQHILIDQVQLISHDHARWLLQETGQVHKLCISTTVFTHTWNHERVELATIQSMKIWRVCTNLVGPKHQRKVLLTSETLHNLGLLENGSPFIEPALDSSLANVESLSISFLNNSTYALLSTRELDEILKKFFQVPKLLFKESVNSIFVQDHLNLETQRLSWVLPPNARLVFKVVAMKCDDQYGSVSQTVTSLNQKRNIIQPLPSEELIMTKSNPPDSIASLPQPLIQFQSEIIVRIKSNVLIQGQSTQGLSPFFISLSSKLGHSLRIEDCALFLGDNSANTEIKLTNALAKASEMRPFLLILKNVHVLSKNREDHLDFRIINRLKREISRLNLDPQCIVIAWAPLTETLDPLLHAVFDHVLPVPDLDTTQEVSKVLDWMIQFLGIDFMPDVNIQSLARKCAGFSFTDLQETLQRAQEQARPLKVNQTIFNECVRQIQDLASDSIGAPRIPQVRWSDIGGLEKAKMEIRDTIDLPLEHPELVANGLKRSGVLLYGPPGTGKTMLAKVVASECNLNFLSVKGPELINPYVGQSEQNIRDIFTQAKKASPSIIFFDELDSLAPNRGNTGDSGGVMDRIVSQLLTQLDDMSSDLVFVIGATNRPDMIDPALLRPGRFDRLIHLGAAQTLEERESIFQSVIQKVKLEPDLRLEAILSLFPEHLTGADITSIVSSASYKAIGRVITQIEAKEDPDISPEVCLTFLDFESVSKEFVPSLLE